MEKTHRLNKIQVYGFKSIQELDLEIRNLNVLIGANGAGKSNFIELFKFIRELVEERMQLFVARKGGAEKMLYYGSKVTQELKVSIDIAPNYYEFKLVPGQGDRLVFEHEYCSYDTVAPKPYRENINNGFLESALGSYNRQHSYRVGNYIYKALRVWRVYHFHDTSDSALVKKKGKISEVDYLREDASNLAAFLLHMQNTYPKHYERIVKTIQLVIPFFKDFKLEPVYNSPDNILLEWTDKHSDQVFNADDLSDGSLRFICLATLLLQPNLPNLILLDEPELGLHPMAIQILAGLLRKASHATQLIVSTQSPNLVSEFTPEDIVVVEHREGASTFQRVNEESLHSWLEEYSLGELWQKNVIGGRP